jgi:hypothetical protein
MPPPDGGYPGGNTAEEQKALWRLFVSRRDKTISFPLYERLIFSRYAIP